MPGKRWVERGVLARVFAELQRLDLESEPSAERVYLDSTIVKGAQHGGVALRNRGAPSSSLGQARRSAARAGA